MRRIIIFFLLLISLLLPSGAMAVYDDGSHIARNIAVEDDAGYYMGENVEEVLQEIPELYLPIGGGTLTGPVYFIDANTYITRNILGDMVFTDVNAGSKTLTELDCPDPLNIHLFALTQSEGNLNLSDATNWNVSKAMITVISVKTSSTNWLLDLYPDDDFDELGEEPSFRACGDSGGILGGHGSQDLFIWRNYTDYDGTNEVHITFTDLSGSNTADIRIYGEKMR